jgi:hypothetical protein
VPTASITLQEPTTEEEKSGVISTKQILEELDKALSESGQKIWILLDRLDIAFAENDEVEKNALRSLFRVYNNIKQLTNIRLKIFLRDDIWDRVTKEAGFREATHITRTVTISWNESSLLFLLTNRFFANPSVEQFLNVKRTEILADGDLQETAFYFVFPDKVEKGEKRQKTYQWMLNRIRDGKQKFTPRELILFVNAALEEQIRLEETGAADKDKNYLIQPAAIKAGLHKVSKYRLAQVLYAEYPSLRGYIDAFYHAKTEHTLNSIKELFAQHGLVDNPEIALRKLVEIGFLEERNKGTTKVFWVPFLYREALDMVQGAGFE